MTNQPISKDLNDTIEDLDKNIKLLKDNEKINLQDCKTLFTQIFEVLKDLLQRFESVFSQVEKIMDIEKSTEKGELYKEKVSGNQDLKNLYL